MADSTQEVLTPDIKGSSTPDTWIQPTISHQVLDYSGSSLIDGIYVKVQRQEVGSLPVQFSISGDIENKLSAMAADADIQREMRLIQDEFDITETDGLNNEV